MSGIGIEIVEVPFDGDTLAAARVEGEVWVVIKRVCEALGLNLRGQLVKLQPCPWAGIEKFSIPSAGGTQRTACIRLKALPMWLATLEANKVSAAIRPKIERYQLKAADVLQAYFFGVEHSVPHQFQMALQCTQLVHQCRQLIELSGRIRLLEARIEELHAMRPLQVQYLNSAATINSTHCNRLRRDITATAHSEVRARIWPDVKAARRDIYRDLGEACSWGGSCQPWNKLPADKIHTAFVVLQRRLRLANKLGGAVPPNTAAQTKLDFN